MKPFFKYPGGKQSELKTINEILKFKNIQYVAEPFVGGGAFFLNKQKPSIINDNNYLVINTYNVVKNKYKELNEYIKYAKTLKNDETKTKEYLKETDGTLCNLYYKSRDVINNNNINDDVLLAFSFIVVRQLCFSGMHRQDKNKKFNVPYGWYKNFNTNLTKEYSDYLQNVDIYNEDFETFFSKIPSNYFCFIDPPYLDRATYLDVDGSKNLKFHEKLYENIKKLNNFMIVHNDNDFYKNTYKDYNIITHHFNYKQIYGKNKNNNKAKTSHLYIYK